jgi:hypothetical protein
MGHHQVVDVAVRQLALACGGADLTLQRVVQVIEGMHPRPKEERNWRPTKTSNMVEKPLSDEAIRALQEHRVRQDAERIAAVSPPRPRPPRGARRP